MKGSPKKPVESDESGWDTDVEEFFQSKSALSTIHLNFGRRPTRESGWDTDVIEYDRSISRLSSLPKHTMRLSRMRKKSPGRTESPKIQEEWSTPRSFAARYPSGKCKSPLPARGSNILDELTDTETDNKKNADDKIRQKQTTTSVSPSVLQQEIKTSDDHLNLSPQKMSKTTMSSNIEANELSIDQDEKIPEPLPTPCIPNERSWSLFSPTEEFFGEYPRQKKKKFGSFGVSHSAKNKTKGKKQQDFEFVRMEQVIYHHKGAIRTMKFSVDGRYLATGGVDAIVRVWFVVNNSQTCAESSLLQTSKTAVKKPTNHQTAPLGSIIDPNPYREYCGHKADVTDLDWSGEKNFILSASIDTTVMLWHPSKTNCLRLFRHADYISSVRFHPSNSIYFVSASYDAKIRIWHIANHRVVAWKKLDTLVTAVAFSRNGKFLALGLFDGQCVFYNFDLDNVRLCWHHTIECRNGRKSAGRVTSIQFFDEDISISDDSGADKYNLANNQCLVTTNDSRIRLFTLENYHINLKTKFKGHKNDKFWIGASTSSDGKFVICGSDEGAIYIWKKNVGSPHGKSGHLKLKKCELIKASGVKGPTLVAIFAPKPSIGFIQHHRNADDRAGRFLGMPKIDKVILSADREGVIRIFVNYLRKPAAPSGFDELSL